MGRKSPRKNLVPGYYCGDCYEVYEGLQQDDAGSAQHFWPCPKCGRDLELYGDITWAHGVAKANREKLQTGPSTPEGKKRAAANHEKRTAKSFEVSRFNGWKHGGASDPNKIRPAVAGKYGAYCRTCDLYELCDQGQLTVCGKQAITRARAMKLLDTPEGHRELAKELAADQYDLVQSLIADMVEQGTTIPSIVTSSQGAVTVKEPRLDDQGKPVIGEDGQPVVDEVYLKELRAHPGLKILPSLTSGLNAAPENYQGTIKTQRQQETQETVADAVRGLFGPLVQAMQGQGELRELEESPEDIDEEEAVQRLLDGDEEDS